MKSTDIKNHKTSISQTHNLEVPGSSPGWSTNKRLISNEIEPFFVSNLQITSCCSYIFYTLFKAFVSLLFHQLNNSNIVTTNPKIVKAQR